jgi:hypothetical protein
MEDTGMEVVREKTRYIAGLRALRVNKYVLLVSEGECKKKDFFHQKSVSSYHPPPPSQ